MKKETIDEFLARGGVIKVIPPTTPDQKPELVRSTKMGPANLLTMDEHDLFHGEKKVSKSSTKKTPAIDFSALPEALKQKYLKEWAASNDNEDNEIG